MTEKMVGRRAKVRRAGKRAVPDATCASLSAYQALLNADCWLLVASNVVNAIGAHSEGDKLDELRRLVAARLEYLQHAAYIALKAGSR